MFGDAVARFLAAALKLWLWCVCRCCCEQKFCLWQPLHCSAILHNGKNRLCSSLKQSRSICHCDIPSLQQHQTVGQKRFVIFFTFSPAHQLTALSVADTDVVTRRWKCIHISIQHLHGTSGVCRLWSIARKSCHRDHQFYIRQTLRSPLSRWWYWVFMTSGNCLFLCLEIHKERKEHKWQL